MNDKFHYAVQLEGKSNCFVDSEAAKDAAEALEVARERLKAPDAKHLKTEVFKNQEIHEVIRG